MVAAGAFGFLWHETIIHGDGLVARSDYDVLRVASGVVAPLGVGAVRALLPAPPNPEHYDERHG